MGKYYKALAQASWACTMNLSDNEVDLWCDAKILVTYEDRNLSMSTYLLLCLVCSKWGFGRKKCIQLFAQLVLLKEYQVG